MTDIHHLRLLCTGCSTALRIGIADAGKSVMSKPRCADPEPHRRAGRTTLRTRSANGDAGRRRPERQRATDDGVNVSNAHLC